MVVLVLKWGFFERFEYNMKMIIYKINYWWLLYIKILDLVCLVLIRFDLLILNDNKYFLFYIYNLVLMVIMYCLKMLRYYLFIGN